MAQTGFGNLAQQATLDESFEIAVQPPGDVPPRRMRLSTLANNVSFAVFPVSAGTEIGAAGAAPVALTFGAAERARGAGIARAAGNASLTLGSGIYDLYLHQVLDRTSAGAFGNNRGNVRVLISNAADDSALDDRAHSGYLRGGAADDTDEGVDSHHLIELAAETTIEVASALDYVDEQSLRYTTQAGSVLTVVRRATASAANDLALSDADPEAPGAASGGAAGTAARGDHRHPLPSGAQLETILDAYLGSSNWRQSIQGGLTAVGFANAAAVANLRAGANPANLALATASFARGGAALYLTDGTQPAQIRSGDLFVFDSTNNRWERAVQLPAAVAAQVTNLTISRAADSVTVESSTGTNAQIPAASQAEAGVMSAADKTAVDGAAQRSGATFTGATEGIEPTAPAHFATRRYVDENAVTPLTAHEADPGAHQDSPRRQASLGLSAPVGRRVYLTEDTTHPPMEQIFQVPLGDLGPNTAGGSARFVGATVLDFSGDPVNGPVATADRSAFPAIMNVSRVSGIWQDDEGRDEDIYLAIGIAGALGAVGPTHMHLTGPRDERVSLEQVRITGPIGGVAQRIMRTRGANFLGWLAALEQTDDGAITFSLEYPPANVGQPIRYLTSAGAFALGTGHTAGEYESIGNGQWRARAEGIIAQLVSALASASDADKFALVAALHANPEVLYTENAATQKGRNQWFNVQLSREIVAADTGKIIVIRFWNTLREAEAYLPVRRFLTLTPMNPNDDEFDQRGIALPFYSGDGEADHDFKVGRERPLLVGRPPENVQTFSRIILGNDGFGAVQAQRWGVFQAHIELRSLV